MKVLMINSVCGIRSTGRICTDISTELLKQGHDVRIAYGRESVPVQYQEYSVRIGSSIDIKTHGVLSRVFDCSGFCSTIATRKLVKWIMEYDPDIIHLHNLHGYYLNVDVLFEYLRGCGKKIVWTLHDCWAFTGHCAYYDYVHCDQWKRGCTHCDNKKEYPSSLFLSRSGVNYKKKKELFSGIPNLHIVTPSRWLAEEVKQSFLSEYSISVINNGIDTNVFYHRSNCYFKFKNIKQKIILGVASPWHKRKGLDVFLELSKILDADIYRIVLVGLTQKQIDELPDDIIGIKQTNSVDELAQIYSSAFVFVNPTYEDNYPTTNLESIACGTPVITFNTGGSPESASKFGISIPKGDVNGIVDAIKKIQMIQKFDFDFDKSVSSKKYYDLYEDVISNEYNSLNSM